MAQVQAQKTPSQADVNTFFMQHSYEQPAAMFPQNGNSFNQGQALTYDAPILSGAWLNRLLIKLKLQVTYTPAASNPTAPLLTAAGIWGAINQINVKFGETQVSIAPYMLYLMSLMRGFNRPDPTRVNGYQDTNVQSLLYSAPTLNSGVNNWELMIPLDLCGIHPNSVIGLLPLGQTGTKAQVQIVPTTSFVGNDPLNSVVYGTNGTIAVTGTVDVTAVYRDYKSFSTTAAIAPNLTNLPTLQVIKPAEINPLTAGTTMFRSITNPYPVVRMFSLIIDGQSSGTFCNAQNIQTLELDQAENTNSAFYRYDSTTGGMENYFEMIRRKYGQDLPSGAVAWIDAPTHNVANPSSFGGQSFLDLTGNGYPAGRLGVKVGAVGESATTGITPRVVTYAQILNPSGITLA